MRERTSIILMRITYIFNILVAGGVGIIALFVNDIGNEFLFGEDVRTVSNASYIAGSFWIAIAANSCLGIWRPFEFAGVFGVQLIYKFLFLVIRIIPGLIRKDLNSEITGVSVFFLVWVLWLPFIIPWRHMFKREKTEDI
jgi:hypothetical protein